MTLLYFNMAVMEKTKRKFKSKWHEEQHKACVARAKGYAKRYKDGKGESMTEIAISENVSRQKVQSLIASVK